MPRLEPVRTHEADPVGLAADALGVVRVAAELGDTGTPAVPFGLTAAMARRGAGAAEVVDALLAVRDAVVRAAGLDPATEPVPLVVGDPEVAALSLAAYLHGLLDRAAGASRSSHGDVAERSLELLRAG